MSKTIGWWLQLKATVLSKSLFWNIPFEVLNSLFISATCHNTLLSHLRIPLSLSLTLSHSHTRTHTHTHRETHTRTFFYLLFHLPVFFLLFIDDLFFIFLNVIDLMVLILYFLWYMNMQLFRLHVIFFSPLHLRWRWPFNRLRSEPSLVCIRPTFACRSLPISSLLPPSLRCLLLHTVDKAMARSCVVFLVTSEIHHSRHYYKKRQSRYRAGNPWPFEWQASMLIARPCHSLMMMIFCYSIRKFALWEKNFFDILFSHGKLSLKSD